jgi:hypothetical protein
MRRAFPTKTEPLHPDRLRKAKAMMRVLVYALLTAALFFWYSFYVGAAPAQAQSCERLPNGTWQCRASYECSMYGHCP